MLIRLAVRRFRCQEGACPAVTIVGQADGLTTRYQRRSVPLARLLAQPRPEPLPPSQQERQVRPGPKAERVRAHQATAPRTPSVDSAACAARTDATYSAIQPRLVTAGPGSRAALSAGLSAAKTPARRIGCQRW